MTNHLNNRLADLLDMEAAIEAGQSNGSKKSKREEAPEQEKFGLTEYVPQEVVVTELTDEQDKSDKELARASIRNVLMAANDNLGALLQLARGTEHPRAFEVAAAFAKTIVEAAGKLDDMVDPKTQKGKGSKNEPDSGNTYNQQNNIYMSTEDAMKMLRNLPTQSVENSVVDSQPKD